MDIRHKGIEHEVTTDAPFIGARICAINCLRNCPGCFNQHKREDPEIIQTDTSIIAEVLQHKLNKGVIFGGLEWTYQPHELLRLVNMALTNELKVIIYTGMSLEEFMLKFPTLCGVPVWVKAGSYDSARESHFDEVNDVLLASDNQMIYWLGGKDLEAY